jgi:hypothetical protein
MGFFMEIRIADKLVLMNLPAASALAAGYLVCVAGTTRFGL